MSQIKSFRDLIVWQTSMDLADVCFDIVEAIPHPFKFAIADPLIRARRRFVPDALLARGSVLVEPIGKMLHGLTDSLEHQGEQ